MTDASRPDPADRLIAFGDVDTIDALPVDTVLLCRVGEVFQVKALPIYVDGRLTYGRAWFALGYGDRVWKPSQVATWGPLRVLYRPEDIPEHIQFCSDCHGTGQDLEMGRSDPLAADAPKCPTCAGSAYWNTLDQTPITIPEAI